MVAISTHFGYNVSIETKRPTMNHYEIKIAFIRNAIAEAQAHAIANKYSKHHQNQLAQAYAILDDIIYNTARGDELFQDKQK
jgi:hypothetical protein